MPLEDAVDKELYQRLSAKVQNVAQKITQQVQATTHAWEPLIAVDENGVASPSEPEF